MEYLTQGLPQFLFSPHGPEREILRVLCGQSRFSVATFAVKVPFPSLRCLQPHYLVFPTSLLERFLQPARHAGSIFQKKISRANLSFL